MTVNVCAVETCDRDVKQQGLCAAHGERLRRTGDLGLDRPVKRRSEMPKSCTENGCDAPVSGGGLCAPHYAKAFRKGFRSSGAPLPCQVDDCEEPLRSKGYCAKHYSMFRRWGSPVAPERPAPALRKRSGGGYVMVKAPESPMAMANGCVLEHRLVMSEVIGRPLLKFENVHHINGVRDDNRPENLELWNTYQPSGQRLEEKVEWAVEILRLYAPDRLAQE